MEDVVEVKDVLSSGLGMLAAVSSGNLYLLSSGAAMFSTSSGLESDMMYEKETVDDFTNLADSLSATTTHAVKGNNKDDSPVLWQ